MFGKESSDSDDRALPPREKVVGGPQREERRVAAWIGASLVITGDLNSSEDMTIAGRVDGDVSVPKHAVVIAPGARIRGSIIARAVAVHGTVLGSITADRRVEVGQTGTVEGDVTAPNMAIAEGAALRGRLKIAGS